MEEKRIWEPVSFDRRWKETDTRVFDVLYPSWEKRRMVFKKEPDQYKIFFDELKRKQAIDTGILESMYDLKRGITETFIKEGFIDSYLRHGDTDISPVLLMDYLRDNFDALDFIFDFIKNNRQLSTGYIKELHSLITRHQSTTDAVTPDGQKVHVNLLHGQYKKHPNNPMRDGVIYEYCPPEQVASEMDNLVGVFNAEPQQSVHVLKRAAFLHHAFVTIHPFQDGNGRIARLLASFVLIKEGLFPLSIDRDDGQRYIAALESADNKQYQPIVDIIANNQIASIRTALNWNPILPLEYSESIQVLSKKLEEFRNREKLEVNQKEKRKQMICANMECVFETIKSAVCLVREEIANVDEKIKTHYEDAGIYSKKSYYYQHQVMKLADAYNYYANYALCKCWAKLSLNISDNMRYRLVFSLHHYGYSDTTFVLVGFLLKIIDSDTRKAENKYEDISLNVEPLVMSSEGSAEELRPLVEKYILSAARTAILYIANDIGREIS